MKAAIRSERTQVLRGSRNYLSFIKHNSAGWFTQASLPEQREDPNQQTGIVKGQTKCYRVRPLSMKLGRVACRPSPRNNEALLLQEGLV